jgi:hypothetical protein
MSYRDGNRFDWFDTLDAGFISPLVETVVNDILSASEPSNYKPKTDKTRTLVKVVISSLYAAYSSLSGGWVSFPKSRSAYSTKDPNKVPYSYREAIKVHESLEKLGWIKVLKGNEQNGYTRISAAGHLKQVFEEQEFQWLPVELKPKDQLVELYEKLSKNKRIRLELPTNPEYTSFVESTQDALHQYNAFITQQCICLDLTDDHLKQIAESISKDTNRDPVCFYSTQLRRIFSRGSLQQGGRFYGGWWQQLPEKYRAHITINGEKTVEVDFSSVAFTILYAARGYYIEDGSDPYDIGLSDWQGKDDTRRKVIKVFMNAMINDDKGTYRLPADLQAKIGMSHQQLKTEVLRQHSAIADDLVAGKGLWAQFKDSQIAFSVMESLAQQGIPVLPIHDSFIVRCRDYGKLFTEMFIGAVIYCNFIHQTDANPPRSLSEFGLKDVDHEFNKHTHYSTEVIGEGFSNQTRMNQFYLSWLRQRPAIDHNDKEPRLSRLVSANNHNEND